MYVITGEGYVQLLNALLTQWYPSYHLFVNDFAPTQESTLADFTEASWPDYAPKLVRTFTPALWGGVTATSFADPQLWVRGTGGPPAQVYGYFVTDGTSGPLVLAERRVYGPVPMVNALDRVLVLPSISLGNCCP